MLADVSRKNLGKEVMQVEEIFVEIPGYSNYAVSNYGTVCNVKHERDLTPQPDSKGRMLVQLYKNGIPKTFFVHRLVAQAFFVDYDDDADVYHISEDKADNCITNLHLERRLWSRD